MSNNELRSSEFSVRHSTFLSRSTFHVSRFTPQSQILLVGLWIFVFGLTHAEEARVTAEKAKLYTVDGIALWDLKKGTALEVLEKKKDQIKVRWKSEEGAIIGLVNTADVDVIGAGEKFSEKKKRVVKVEESDLWRTFLKLKAQAGGNLDSWYHREVRRTKAEFQVQIKTNQKVEMVEVKPRFTETDFIKGKVSYKVVKEEATLEENLATLKKVRNKAADMPEKDLQRLHQLMQKLDKDIVKAQRPRPQAQDNLKKNYKRKKSTLAKKEKLLEKKLLEKKLKAGDELDREKLWKALNPLSDKEEDG